MITIKVDKSQVMPSDYSMFISFPYNETVLNIVRNFRDRAWIKESKQWEVPLSALDVVLDAFSKYDIEIYGTYVDLSPREEVTDINFDFKTKPFEHQKEAFLFGLNHDKWFLGDDQGLGKTKQAIDIAVDMKQERGYKHCLIICGVNSLKWNWRNEVSIHSDETAYILGQRTKKRTGEIYIGSNKDKLADIQALESNSSYFIITNVESLRDDNILSYLVKSVESDTINMIVCDEFHKIATSSNSTQSKAIMKLKPEYRLAMTGTPLMNTPLDLYGVLRWLGVETHSFFKFKQYYAVMGGFGGYEIVGYKHLDELQADLDSVMLRRKKDDVLDLPDKVYVDEYVDMLAKQAIVYKEVKSEIKSNIDMIEVSPNPLAEMIRLRQATGYTGILSSEIQCSAKLDRMYEIVEECISNNHKVVVFSNWTSITTPVFERLAEFGPLKITGETADNERQNIVDAFQNNDNFKVLIGTTGALGTGVTLTKATTVILLDEPWNRALREQAVDRCYRIGQNQKVTVYTIMCKGTIDERIHDLVEQKGEMSDMLVDGNINKVDKKALVEFLLS